MNNRTGNTLCLLSLAFFLSLSVPALAPGQIPPDPAGLAPPETALLLKLDNFSQLRERFEKTSVFRLYKDPAMSAFVQDLKTRLQEESEQVKGKVAQTVFDEEILPQGRVALALVLNKQAIDAREPMALFLIQWGSNIGKIKDAVDDAAKKAVEDGMHLASEDYRDITIKTIRVEGSSRLPYGFSSKLSYCFVDDCLIGSEDIEVLKFAIAQTKGAGSPTLAGNANYAATQQATGPYHDVDVYVNIRHIIKTLLATDATDRTKTIVTNLGFDNVSSFGCSIGVARAPGSSIASKACLKIEGAKKGVFKMLEAESAALRPPRFIPASACSVVFANLDLGRACDELANILKSFSPQAAAVMYMPLLPPSPDGEPGVELKRDIIDHLGSQIVVAQSANKTPPATIPSIETFFAVAVNNRRELEKSLSLLHSRMLAPNKPDARRELLGHTIYLLSLGGFSFPSPGATPMDVLTSPSPAAPPTRAFTVTDTHLILGIESAVERAVRALANSEVASVDSAKWFGTGRAAIPTAVGFATLQDDAAAVELTWQMIREKAKSVTGGTSPTIPHGIAHGTPLGPILSQTGLDSLDFSLLPEFDSVRKYFGQSVFYGISRTDGFFFESKYLDCPGSD